MLDASDADDRPIYFIEFYELNPVTGLLSYFPIGK